MPNHKNNKIYLFDYDKDNLEEKKIVNINDCLHYKETPSVTWINIDSVPPINSLQELQLGFNLHPVVIDDILNTNQRPKIEILDDYIFISFKMLTFDKKNKRIQSEQISLILAKQFLLTFQEGLAGDTFDTVRNLIRKGKTRLRTSGTDYLAYELIDSAVSNYFKILEDFGERIEKLESELIKRPDNRTLANIYLLKRELLILRKAIWPMREIMSVMERGDSLLIGKSTKIFLRDVYERIIQIIDTVETYRDMLSGMLDIYLSSINNRMGEVIKVLTVITTVFMPLTFLSGFYGMNFIYLPGLKSPIGPIAISSLMAIILITMLFLFKRKKWI